jgi:hypothetical protein
MHRDENLLTIWKTVESATSADAVTAIRPNRMGMLKVSLMCGGDGYGNSITKIAVWRIHSKPEQQNTQEPCAFAVSVTAAHTNNNKWFRDGLARAKS